jgi:hypothetical protein
MPATSQPELPLIDLVRLAVQEAIANSSFAVSNFPTNTAINNLTPLQDLVRDKKTTEVTDSITSASPSQVVSGARQMRSLFFVNYQAATLYVQVFNTATAPAVGAVPILPPFPIQQNQTFLLDQQMLGVDWLGYPEYTVRISTQPYTYSPTASTAGIWHLVVRGKS